MTEHPVTWEQLLVGAMSGIWMLVIILLADIGRMLFKMYCHKRRP